MVLLFFSSHAACYGMTRPDQEVTVWKEGQETRSDPFVLSCDLEQRTEEAGSKCFSLESSDFSSHVILLSSVLLKVL